MRRLALALIAATALTGCGGDDRGPAPERADTTPAVSRDVARLRDLCARAGDSVPAYEAFVRDLKGLDAPRQIAIQERMQGRVQSAGTVDAVHEAYAADDAADARMGLIDCIWPASMRGRALKAPEQICADNRARTARARALAPDARDAIAQGGSERLARLIAAAPRPADDAPEYGGWTDALATAANLYRLADGTSDAGRARALRAQAGRTAAAARKTAGKLGLSECAKA